MQSYFMEKLIKHASETEQCLIVQVCLLHFGIFGGLNFCVIYLIIYDCKTHLIMI